MPALLKTQSILTLLTLVSILLHSPAFAYTRDKVYSLTLLHTDDHHGRYWQNENGEYGMAAQATLIRKIREEVSARGGSILLLSGGDINTGVPESDLQKAKPDFLGMKALGYDAMAVGNHEFDHSLEVIRNQQEWAGFPFLSANIFYSTGRRAGKRVFDAHVDLVREDLKISVFGMTTTDTPLVTNPRNTQGLAFHSPVEIARQLVPSLRKKGADVVIAVTHMGHEPTRAPQDAEDDIAMAQGVSGIDIIVGGHTQKPLFTPDRRNGTWIVQAHEWGKYIGRMDLEFLNGNLTLKNYRLIPVNLLKPSLTPPNNDRPLREFLEPEIPQDSAMLALLTPFQSIGENLKKKEIGKSQGIFDGERESIRFRETELGNLITEAFRQETGADIAIMNSGGIRKSLPEGSLNYHHLFEVLPFDNSLCVVTLSSEELRRFFLGMMQIKPGKGGFPQTAGIELTYFEKENRLADMKINGIAIDEKRKYKLAIPDFIAAGGDGYLKLSDHRTFKDTRHRIVHALKQFIESQENSTVDPKRFIVKNQLSRR